MTSGPRTLRPHLPDVRPLDSFRSLKIKLGVLVFATVTLAVLITWLGQQNKLGPTRTFPLAIVLSLLLTQILARGMTSPLREMTAAARSMADGDYTRRVRATSRDEVGQLAVAFNIMAEDLASSDQMRRELIANVSHELRTPIAALQAQLENVVDGVSEANPATMEMALAQTERLTRLVTYLLDLSRIEAGAAALNIQDVPLGDFLEENADAVSMVEAGKHLQYVIDVTPEDLTLPADPERLRQIITNLLQNAIRHSPQNGEIRLEAYPVDDEVVIEVIDQGPGIAKKDRERIFERFARGNAPSHGHTSTGGTGIGLAIVRWAVDLHGGRIEVADSLQGATMRLTFPAHPHPHTTGLPDDLPEILGTALGEPRPTRRDTGEEGRPDASA
ncbi:MULTISPECIES: cell wall metabolism sensor histidine kinase WalK [unclassified Oerskovia]|uniref:sensor histidine kinase n=1 Tax=unclassified Oerskovia TaxID=2619021 RepID=UPI0009E74D1F|nr:MULTISPECIES: HAMP domain-containing sensor histidine kinase [unclassified Oerskovia]